ncbi:hypothetical protein AXE65_10760, partial [Ventosimonas gracilis]
ATAPAALAALSATQANSSASSGSAGSGSAAEQSLALQLRAARIPFVREYRFAAMATGGTGEGLRERLAKAGLKDWRFDFALPAYNLAIEIEGGSWTNGRHTRGKGFSEDLIKYDAAMRLGFNVYRCDSRMVQSGQALQTVQRLIERS